MFRKKISKIIKRDGNIVNFDRDKIVSAISRACVSVGVAPKIANELADKVEYTLFKKYSGRLPTVENVQEVVEDVLHHSNHTNVCKVFILYRQKRSEIRDAKKFYGI